jgi:hypothetical protein
MQRIGDRLIAGEWYGPWQDYWLAYVMCWAASPSVPPSPRLSPLADPKTLGARVADAMGDHRRIVPMILFQGTADVTVKPANGEALVAQWAEIGDLARERMGAAADQGTMTTEQGAVRDGRSYTLTTCRDANGKVLIRAYEVEGMGPQLVARRTGRSGRRCSRSAYRSARAGRNASDVGVLPDHPMPPERRQAAPARATAATSARQRARPAKATSKTRTVARDEEAVTRRASTRA